MLCVYWNATCYAFIGMQHVMRLLECNKLCVYWNVTSYASLKPLVSLVSLVSAKTEKDGLEDQHQNLQGHIVHTIIGVA